MNQINPQEFQAMDSHGGPGSGSLGAIIQHLHHVQSRKADLVQNSSNMQLRTVTPYLPWHSGVDGAYKGESEKISEIIVESTGGVPTQTVALNPVAFNQLAQKTGIATRDARRFQSEYPEEFDRLVNAILRKEPANRMIRAYQSKDDNYLLGRAFVSDAFRTYDNYDLLQAALPPLLENTDAAWRTVNATVTAQKMYLRFKSNNFEGQGAAVGDAMAAGVVISNSEVGMGSITVGEVIWTLACLNGMQTQNLKRSAHIQSARGEQSYGILAADTREKDNELTSLKMRDYVREFSSRENFDATLEKFRAAADDVISDDVEKQTVVENLGTVLQLTKSETSSVLEGLIQTMSQSGYAGNPLSRATLVNAVTAVANKAEPDTVDDWQKLGGRVLELPRRDWARVAAAA